MEQTSAFNQLVDRVQRSASLEGIPSNQAELLTEDLGTFLVAHHILITGVDSVAAVKAYFRQASGMEDLVDDLLAQLEAVDLISVDEDKISVNQRFIDIAGNTENLLRFLPRIFKVASQAVLSDISKGEHKSKKEGVRYFIFPDDKESAAEAMAIYLEFKVKMLNLISKVQKEGRSAEKLRFVGLVNYAMNPEDFQ